MEIYEYAGAYGYKNQGDGQDFVRLRMEEIEAAAKHFDASGDDDHVQCGRSFILAGHLNLKDLGSEEGDNEFLVVAVIWKPELKGLERIWIVRMGGEIV